MSETPFACDLCGSGTHDAAGCDPNPQDVRISGFVTEADCAARVAAARADERAWFQGALTSDVGDLLDVEWLRENWWVKHVLAARFALTESADAQVVPCVKDCPPPDYVCHCAAQPTDTDGADQ